MPPVIAAAAVATAIGTTVAGSEAAKKQEEAAIEAQQKAEATLTGAGEQARADVQAAEEQAQQALQTGAGGAREDIQAGTAAAADPLRQLAGTQAIQTADVVSGSKLGQLFSEGFDFEASPGFRFRQEQGEKALGRFASARGGRSSGRLAMELAEFNSGLASQEFGAAFERRFRGAQAVDALAASQAGRQDVAGLQAQGLGAGGLSQLAQLFSGEGQNLAGINQSTAALLAQLFASGGAQQAGIGTGTASQIAGTFGSTVPFAGGELQSLANTGGAFLELGANVAGNVAGGAAAASDVRMKKNVRDAGDDVEAYLDSLNPVAFEYLGNDEQHFGILAQDVEKSAAGATVVTEVDGVKMIDLKKALMLTLAANANLNARVRALEGKPHE